jgi:hypothetical protein
MRLDSIETKDVFLRVQAAPADSQMGLENDLARWFVAHLDWLNHSI